MHKIAFKPGRKRPVDQSAAVAAIVDLGLVHPDSVRRRHLQLFLLGRRILGRSLLSLLDNELLAILDHK